MLLITTLISVKFLKVEFLNSTQWRHVRWVYLSEDKQQTHFDVNNVLCIVNSVLCTVFSVNRKIMFADEWLLILNKNYAAMNNYLHT